ncbi:VOC family protein [Arthrobacter agilis]|uniref:VOC family protein n=1 Tax=Arthrobacter agilis TaxID=37921 RepID=UPI002781DFF2|nr:VOC family protein [Arthrobacter agilis]MDQ0737021.1 hypothetical protein [Arthrobacter agilis]
MLRVRLLVHTSDVPAAAGFLRALGLHPAQEPFPDASPSVFDAGSGRVALRSCRAGSAEDGRTALAFDVGDVREFARRTVEAGTAVELSAEGAGLSARITAPDGTSFLADEGPRETGAPASPLSVLALWHTPDVLPATRVLGDMGARSGNNAGEGARHDFRAKNGGIVSVRPAGHRDVELAFAYDGDVRDLAGDLGAGGFDPVVADEGPGRSVWIRAPWGAGIRIHEEQRDSSG